MDGTDEAAQIIETALGPRQLADCTIAAASQLAINPHSAHNPRIGWSMGGWSPIGKLGAVSNHKCEIRGVKFRAGLLNHWKIWWPGTELNRRGQPFQNSYCQCFQQLQWLPWDCQTLESTATTRGPWVIYCTNLSCQAMSARRPSAHVSHECMSKA